MNLDLYPSPIKIVYQEMLDEHFIQLKFRALIRTFGTTLKFISLVAINDYIRLRNAATINSPRINKLLVNITCPSMGHWNELLREILRECSGIQNMLFVPQLFDLYFKRKKGGGLEQSASAHIINRLIEVRNLYVHADLYPPKDASEEYYHQYKKDLDQLLNSLSFLEAYNLCRASPVDCQNNIPNSPEMLLQHLSYIQRKGNNPAANDELSLGCFLYNPSSHIDRKYLYESFKNSSIIYIHGHILLILEKSGDSQGFVKEMATFIANITRHSTYKSGPEDNQCHSENMLPDFHKNYDISWSVLLKNVMQHVSYPTLNGFLSENKFDHSLYVERTIVNDIIADFLASSKTALIVVGESGLGKTNLFCRWFTKLYHEGHIVFFLYGRNYDGGDIADFLLGEVKEYYEQKNKFEDISNLLLNLGEKEQVRSEGKKLIVLIDAINEYNDPAAFLKKIVDFTQSVKYPWVKIIISIRSFVWDSLQQSQRYADPDIFYYTTDGAGERVPCVYLRGFQLGEASSGNELREAYALYKRQYGIKTDYSDLSHKSRQFLSNPLHLRLTTEAYENSSLPNEMFTGKVFSKYVQHRINEKDIFFIDYLAEAMWRTGEDYITQENIRPNINGQKIGPLDRETKLRIAHSCEGLRSMCLSEKLREYIYTDPVYGEEMFSQVLVCTNPACRKANHLLPIGIDRRCSVCQRDLKEREEDVRTTYVRLQDENIIKEFQIDEYFAIRFNYDRMFEYFVGRVLEKTELDLFLTAPSDCLYGIIKQVGHKYIFWGAIANAIKERMRDITTTNSVFWQNLLAGEGFSTDEDSEIFRQIVVRSLVELAKEQWDKVVELFCIISSEPHISKNVLRMVLSVYQETWAIENEGIVASSETMQSKIKANAILIRALESADSQISALAVRVLFTAIKRRPENVFEIVDILKGTICHNFSSSKDVAMLLAFSSKRKSLFKSLDTFGNIILPIMGWYADSKDKSIFDASVERVDDILQSMLKGPWGGIGRAFFLSYIVDFIREKYWEKPYYCNAIEMYLFRKHMREYSSKIADLFCYGEKQTLSYNEMESLFSVENGYLSWCVSTVAASLIKSSNQRKEYLVYLKRIFYSANNRSHVQCAIVHTLWILAEFAHHNQLSEIDSIFEECIQVYFERHGHVVTYDYDIALYDKTVGVFFKDAKEPWVKIRKDSDRMVCQYDNGLMRLYAEYLIKKHNVPALDFIVDMLKIPTWTDSPEYTAYVLEELGNIGELNPQISLNTLESILYPLIGTKVKDKDSHKTIDINTMINKALMRIKSFHPQMVDNFIEQLPGAQKIMFTGVLNAKPDVQATSMVMHCGEYLWQVIMERSDIRKLFGDGLRRTGNLKRRPLAIIVQNVMRIIFRSWDDIHMHFSAFAAEFLNWYITLPRSKDRTKLKIAKITFK